MAEYKVINVDPETHENLQKLADMNGRTLGGQVKIMTKWELRRLRIREVAELPHPPDAEPVPLVIAEIEPVNPNVAPED